MSPQPQRPRRPRLPLIQFPFIPLANKRESWYGIRQWQRHSLVLLVAGVVYIAVGLSYALPEPTLARARALYYAGQVMSLEKWGWVFIAVGLLSIVSSRWPPFSETWGYTAMTGLATLWSGFYALSVIFEVVTVASLSGALVWALVGFLWWAIGGLLNPPRPGSLPTSVSVPGDDRG